MMYNVEYCCMDGESIDINNNFMFKNNVIQLGSWIHCILCGCSINPLLSRLCQFINAYRNRKDIRDINVHNTEANLLMRLLQTILILNPRIITVHFWSNSSVFARRYSRVIEFIVYAAKLLSLRITTHARQVSLCNSALYLTRC